MFICLEGIDSCGKFTQSQKLYDFFRKIPGKNIFKLEFPKYDSISGEMVRGFLNDDWLVLTADDLQKQRAYENNAGAYLFQCCQITNRMECLPDEIWQPAQGDVFIADRYNASALAYGKAVGLDFEWLKKIHRNMPKPTVNIFLDISVEESFLRRPERRDSYEKNVGLLTTVRQCYKDIFSSMGDSYVILDAQGSVDDVFNDILSVLRNKGVIQ